MARATDSWSWLLFAMERTTWTPSRAFHVLPTWGMHCVTLFKLHDLGYRCWNANLGIKFNIIEKSKCFYSLSLTHPLSHRFEANKSHWSPRALPLFMLCTTLAEFHGRGLIYCCDYKNPLFNKDSFHKRGVFIITTIVLWLDVHTMCNKSRASSFSGALSGSKKGLKSAPKKCPYAAVCNRSWEVVGGKST